ncbi:MAG: hypothetical protein ACU0FH_02055 [Heliomarina sp.]|uniref:hypothetical protein n=1 Tax=Heliomarina sp. TaxID=2917556 RepID=UPI0040586F7B
MSDEIRLKEYDFLRNEIAERSNQQFVLERNVAIGIGAVFGLIIQLSENEFDSLVNPSVPSLAMLGLWWLPYVILQGGYFRWKANEEEISNIAKFLREGVDEERYEKFKSDADNSISENRRWRYLRNTWISLTIIAGAAAGIQTIYVFVYDILIQN